jgi:hypothetical protein
VIAPSGPFCPGGEGQDPEFEDNHVFSANNGAKDKAQGKRLETYMKKFITINEK